MFLRYLANIVQNNTGVFSTGEELLIALTRTHTHTHTHTHTNKNIQENKQNKKNRTQDFMKASSLLGNLPHITGSYETQTKER